MEIVKKNILSIICGVVALIALTALAWPIGGMYADTQVELDKRKTVDADLTKLMKIPRLWPVIPELETGAPTPLPRDRFPNDAVIQAGTVIKDKVHKQAADMKGTTAENNRHELLVPRILPNPGDQRFRFAQLYMKAVQGTPSDPGTLQTQLQGTAPPTDLDVHVEADKLWAAEYEPKIIKLGGVAVNEPTVVADWQKTCATLEAKLRLQKARSAKVYIEPDWLTIQGKMLASVAAGPGVDDIWFAQNMLWVQQDVVNALARINGGAHDVTDAPIKHIFGIGVSEDAAQYVLGAPTGNANAYANANANGPAGESPGKAYGISPTGRVCNSLYDVIQFQLIMNVDASRLTFILAELQRDKLITVDQLDLSAVDGIAAADDGYIYGDVPVVKVSIRGEELFLRDWTVPLMPDSIKTLLQVPPAVATAK